MSGKLAYVTGGMGGIGTSICRRFHDMGYTVVAGCGPTRDFSKWLAEQKDQGYNFHASVGNVADWESTRLAFERVKAEFGNPDVWSTMRVSQGMACSARCRLMTGGR